MMEEEMDSALFNEERTKRYCLWRIWDNSKHKILFVINNPGLGDEVSDDDDVLYCKEIAKHFGAGGLYICCSYPGLKEDELLDSGDAKNDSVIMQTGVKTGNAIFCWKGNNMSKQNQRDLEIYTILSYIGCRVNVLKESPKRIGSPVSGYLLEKF